MSNKPLNGTDIVEQIDSERITLEKLLSSCIGALALRTLARRGML